jgi:hypothetical protein
VRDGQVHVPEKPQQFSWFKHGVREWGINKNKNEGREEGGGRRNQGNIKPTSI